ncbi:MAG: hypothetical protein P8Z30_07335 [Acidobacteriota bacterium]
MIGRIGLTSLITMVAALGLTAATVAGASLPVGSLVGSRNASLDGHVLLPHTTLLNGDNLQVNNDGLAVLALDHGNRMILGCGTAASFTRGARGVTVAMSSGNVSLFHPQASQTFRVTTGDVTVTPAHGYRTTGEIALVNGLLVVTAKEGRLQVEKAGTTKEVTRGKTIAIATTAGRTPTPAPPGNPHVRHIISHKALFYVGVGAGAVGLTAVTIALTRSTPVASPVLP